MHMIRIIRQFSVTVGLLTFFMLIISCNNGNQKNKDQDSFDFIIGSRGHSSGKFNRPRGICWDEKNGLIYVVDWDGRIQKFTLDGQFRGYWIMPEVKKGKPEDLCLTKDGNILVTDTHYSRIVQFTPDGEVIDMFGSYGKGDGEFIYPVGICVDELENIYVSEYGDNNRVQKFDKYGKFIKSFGGFGDQPGEFQRPSGMAIGPDKNLYVTDGVNHRVQVFDLDGNLIKIIGSYGKKLGELNYPYDIDFKDGFMYILEFGNNRVQKLTTDGKGLAVWGQAGNGDGQFHNPWRFCTVADSLYISDTNNFRVVKITF